MPVVNSNNSSRYLRFFIVQSRYAIPRHQHAPMNRLIEDLLKRDRLVVAMALVTVAGLSWAWLMAGAGMGMNALEMTRHSLMDMPSARPAPWSPAYAVLMLSMWWIMMVAMMLPSVTPVVLLAAAVNRRARPGQAPYGSSAAFVTGYLLAWGGFSLLAVAMQWGLERTGLLNAMGVSTSQRLAGALLLVAGLWQFSPWKQACLAHCRQPVEFLSQHHRPGQRGALLMGAHHGLYCLGCCWFLMVLLFVGGVMNLRWIIGLTIYVWVEKAAPGGPLLARVLGAALSAWGGWLLLTPAA